MLQADELLEKTGAEGKGCSPWSEEGGWRPCTGRSPERTDLETSESPGSARTGSRQRPNKEEPFL